MIQKNFITSILFNKQYLVVVRFSEKDLHKVSPSIKHTDDINCLILDPVKHHIISADQKTVIRFKVYDRGKRSTARRKVSKHTDFLYDFTNRI